MMSWVEILNNFVQNKNIIITSNLPYKAKKYL